MSKQSDRRRRVVRATAPAAGLLAAGLLVWQGSYAAFSATTVDTNNAWSSGSLVLQNNGGTTCLTVKSTGNSAGNLAMYESALADSSPSLGAQIQLTVTAGVPATDVQANCTGFPTTGLTTVATNQPLSTFANTYAGGVPVAVAAGTVLEAYKVVWTFASIGTNPGDSALMGKTVTAGFTWELQ
jgi:hypothetical protein